MELILGGASIVILFSFGVDHGDTLYSVAPSESLSLLLSPVVGRRHWVIIAFSRSLVGNLDALLKVWVRESNRKEVLL